MSSPLPVLFLKNPIPARFPAYQIKSAADETLATVPITASGQSYKLALALAAAPDLLACLEEMLDAFVPTIKSQSRLTQAQGGASINARAAIAKAKGAA